MEKEFSGQMYEPINSINGEKVFTHEYIEWLRENKPDNAVIVQRGCQEVAVVNEADILIFGGNRGGSKSFTMLLKALYDVYNSGFIGLIMRNERDDLSDIIEVSEKQIYKDFGEYNRSKDLMSWIFKSGGKLRFNYYGGSYSEFETRFRGRQFAYIGVDEITQMDYKKFKFLLTCNRNTCGLKNKFIGTCNPDPDSWVRKFIDWWIGEDGLPIDERDGVIRYCFMDGDTVDTIFWGDTPEEVYEQCYSIIDKLWKPEYEELGFNKKTMFIKSVCFIRGRLEQNIALIANDPNYTANLAQQSEEARARDLDGNWNFKSVGGDRISMDDMEAFFKNPIDTSDTTPYVSGDIAFEGGDFAVLWLWIGFHIKDVRIFTGNSNEVEQWVKACLLEWGVREENFVFDYWGVGQAVAGHVTRAVKFKGTEKPQEPFDKSYKNVKSQCAEMLVHAFQDRKLSIEPYLLDKVIKGKTKIANLKRIKYASPTKLRDILMKERKCIRHKENSSVGGFELIDKKSMIEAVGYSPDFFESLIYRMWFEIGKKRTRPKGLLQFSNNVGGGKLYQGRLVKVKWN